MPFTYERTIRFADTDAAGVVFFANYAALCHEAYEEALAAAGLALRAFFADGELIVPVSKCAVDFLRPLQVGDRVRITLHPQRLSPSSFAIEYELQRLTPPIKLAARARTEHVSSSRQQRERVPLPSDLAAWVDAG